MGLLQVIVAFAMLGVLSLGVAQVASDSVKISSRQGIMQDIDSFIIQSKLESKIPEINCDKVNNKWCLAHVNDKNNMKDLVFKINVETIGPVWIHRLYPNYGCNSNNNNSNNGGSNNSGSNNNGGSNNTGGI